MKLTPHELWELCKYYLSLICYKDKILSENNINNFCFLCKDKRGEWRHSTNKPILSSNKKSWDFQGNLSTNQNFKCLLEID